MVNWEWGEVCVCVALISILGYKGMGKGGNEREHLGVNLLQWVDEEVLGL